MRYRRWVLLCLGLALLGCQGAPSSVAVTTVPALSATPEVSVRPTVPESTSTPSPTFTAIPRATPTSEPTARTAPPTLLVTNAAARHVSFVDPMVGVIKQVEVGVAPWGVALGPDDLAYVATAEGVSVVDVRRQVHIADIPYRAAVGPPTFGEYRAGGMGIAVAPDGRFVYVGVFLPDRSGRLEVIDVAQRLVIASVPIGVRPFQVVVRHDGREVYTIDHDTFTVTAVDTSTYAARTLPVQPFGNGGWSSWDKPHYAVLRADGDLLLPVQGEALVVLDPISGQTTTKSMHARTHQHGVALTADERRLLIVGTGPAGDATGSPRLTVLELETGDERTIALERPHELVVLSSDERFAYLTGGYTFANGGWDGLSIVDLEQGTVRDVPVPDRPLAIVVVP